MKTLLSILLLAALTQARTLVVAPTGGNDANAATVAAPLATIQAAVTQAVPGDTILLRGGTYAQHSINLSNKAGTAAARYTMRSYPGEWAKVDGGHSGPLVSIFYNVDGATVAFWRFENFEVCGAGPPLASMAASATGAGFVFWPAHSLHFERMYIHDNYGGGTNNGGAGIKIANGSTAAHNITITRCYLKDNGWPGVVNENISNIVLFADYIENPAHVNVAAAMSRNEISYNLILGSSIGVKHKQHQHLANHTGDDLTHAAYASRIHHNIIRKANYAGILAREDFVQVNHNVVDSCYVGIMVGEDFKNRREPFHSVVYNNRVTAAERISFNFAKGGEDSPGNYLTGPTRARLYLYNNIFRSQVQTTSEANVLRIYPAYSGSHMVVDRARVDIRNNYFTPATSATQALTYERISNRYTLAQAQDSGMGTGYLADNDLRGYVSTGGVGIAHPYIAGAEIPGYIGPGTAWQAEVEALVNLPAGNATPPDTTLPPDGPCPPDTTYAPAQDTSRFRVIRTTQIRTIVVCQPVISQDTTVTRDTIPD